LRNGRKLLDGYGLELGFSNEQISTIIRKADIELDFEEVRRRIPEADPSRLECLWVVLDEPGARDKLHQMLGTAVDIVTFVVRSFRVIRRADSRWIDRYAENRNPEFINRYWLGAPESADPHWEYLLDGCVGLAHQGDAEIVRKAFSDLGFRPPPSTPEG